MAGREPPGAPKTAVRTVGRVGLGPEAAAENAAAVEEAAAGAGAASPANRAEMLEEFMRNRQTHSEYVKMLEKFGIETRSVAAAIAAEGVAMDTAKMKKAQRQNEIMRDGMKEVSETEDVEKKKVILAGIKAALAALEAAEFGGGRRRRRGRGSKTTKRRNHRHRHRKNTRRHR